MEGIITIITVLAIWVLLQKVILPRLGISTCMADACDFAGRDHKKKQHSGSDTAKDTRDE